ncbi:hypothetical protein ACFFRR_008579 [Megaselia abdita]
MKGETLEQIQEFSDTLNRLQKGDLTLNNKFNELKTALREAIGKNAFNTHEMIKMFGAQDDEIMQLLKLEEEFKLKKVDKATFMEKKRKILQSLQEKGSKLSDENKLFLKDQEKDLFSRLEEVQ